MTIVRSQTEYNAAVAAGDTHIEISGGEVWLHGSAHVTTISGGTVWLHGSAHVTTISGGTVWLYDSAHVATISGGEVWLHGSARAGMVEPTARVIVYNPWATAPSGPNIVRVRQCADARDWCENYGVEIEGDIAHLFKAVGENHKTQNGVRYTPGTMPVAPDWDGGKEECGGGLHFSPRPWMAREFRPDAQHYVRCPVRVDEIVVHAVAVFPHKIKAPHCAGPVEECDADGNLLEAAVATDLKKRMVQRERLVLPLGSTD